MNCNNTRCSREKANLENRRKAGWKQYFALREEYFNLIFETVSKENIPDAVKRSIKNMIKQIPEWSQDSKCCICTEQLKDTVYFLRCGHFVFHKTCLDTWKDTNNSCPICRTEIEIFCQIEL